MSGNRSQQDKTLIIKGIRDSKEAIKQADYEQALKLLKQIQPIIVRTKLFEFEYSLLRGIIFDKQEKPKECIEAARNAERLKPNDINPSRLLIHSYILLEEDDQLAKEISTFFEKHLNDTNQEQAILVDLIAPHLKQLDDKHHEDITLPFIQCFKKLSNYASINIAKYIPETEDTVQLRCELLRPYANEDQNSCSELIQLLLYEIPEEERDVDELILLSSHLPEDNQYRLLIETYFGQDFIKSARKYDEVTSSNKFQNFIDAFDSNNLKEINVQLNYDPYFSSGWNYYGDQVTNLSEKLSAYQKAIKSNPKSIPILEKISKIQTDLNKIDDAISTIKKIHKINPTVGMKMLISYLIAHGKADEAEKYIGSRDSLPDIDRALLSFLDYEKSHDKSQIEFILKLPVSAEIAEVRARAIYELRDEVGKKAQFMFAECINESKEGPVYLYYARWLDEQGLDKATLVYEQAIEAGVIDDRAFDLVTRKLILEDKLEKALSLCLKVNNEWSHFRAGLILQRQDKHELACSQFQAEIGINPKNYTAWKALAQSYLILGRAMATLSVVQFLNENGQHDKDLEFQVQGIFERPIQLHDDEDLSQSLEIENSPIPLLNFLSQKVTQIKNLSTFGRLETCKLLIERYEEVVDSYHKKWGALGAVLRICGQFFLESYKITKNVQHAQKAIQIMKRHAEIDVRPETFIDLSSVFFEMKKYKEASLILQKVIRKFPDNAQLWTNLGITFSLIENKMPFARHCLCVAALIASDSEMARIYSLCCSIAMMMDDMEFANNAAQAADRANPNDPSVQLVKLLLISKSQLNRKKRKNNGEEEEEEEAPDVDDENVTSIADKEAILKEQLDLALLSFEYGASPQIIANIPRLCLQLNRPIEALGFALSSNDNELISSSYEALGRYEDAMNFTEEEETKERLTALIGKDQELYETANLMNHNQYKEAIDSISSDSLISEITKAVCIANNGQKEEAAKILFELRRKVFDKLGPSELLNSIDRLVLLYSPPKMKLGSVGVSRDYRLLYLKNMKKLNDDEKESAKELVKKLPNDPNAVKVFIIQQLFNGYFTKNKSDVTLPIIQKAQSLVALEPSRQTHMLLLSAQIKEKLYKDAFSTIQKLCVMEPNMIPKYMNLLKMLNEKVESEKDKQKDVASSNNNNQNQNNVRYDDDDDIYYDDDDDN